MEDAEHKLQVLAEIAAALNEHQVLWAVGGSLLLYFHGKTDMFHDLDLMIAEQDAEQVKHLLEAMGSLAPKKPNPGYRTRGFLEFTIEQVEIDVMAGMVIVREGQEYDCSLQEDQIDGFREVHGERIPLQKLSLWRRYYALMGRDQKVAMIDG